MEESVNEVGNTHVVAGSGLQLSQTLGVSARRRENTSQHQTEAFHYTAEGHEA